MPALHFYEQLEGRRFRLPKDILGILGFSYGWFLRMNAQVQNQDIVQNTFMDHSAGFAPISFLVGGFDFGTALLTYLCPIYFRFIVSNNRALLDEACVSSSN